MCDAPLRLAVVVKPCDAFGDAFQQLDSFRRQGIRLARDVLAKRLWTELLCDKTLELVIPQQWKNGTNGD